MGGGLTNEHPKCMAKFSPTENILPRQIRLLAQTGIKEVVMTKGYFYDLHVDVPYSKENLYFELEKRLNAVCSITDK